MSDFSTQQVKTLAKLLGRQPCEVPKVTPEWFLLRYVFLEALVRLVVHYCRDRNTTQKKAPTDDSSLNVEVVKRSLKYLGVFVDERRVDGLLASMAGRRICATGCCTNTVGSQHPHHCQVRQRTLQPNGRGLKPNGRVTAVEK